MGYVRAIGISGCLGFLCGSLNNLRPESELRVGRPWHACSLFLSCWIAAVQHPGNKLQGCCLSTQIRLRASSREFQIFGCNFYTALPLDWTEALSMLMDDKDHDLGVLKIVTL